MVDLKPFNTFGIEATALDRLHPDTPDGLVPILQNLKQRGTPFYLLGQGSNILFTKDFKGTIITLPAGEVSIAEDRPDKGYAILRASAGYVLDDLCRYASHRGLSGIEGLSGIPGTIAGAVVQNAGAYGQETVTTLHRIRIAEPDTGLATWIDPEINQFGYRQSPFKKQLKGKAYILEVELKLSYSKRADEKAIHRSRWADDRTDAPTPLQLREHILKLRAKKLPDTTIIGSAGSFFKNISMTADQRNAFIQKHPQAVFFAMPDGAFRLSAGWLIEQAGWKGYRKGDAAVDHRSALVLVNHGRASGAEILQLSQEIMNDVLNKFGQQLEREVILIGEFGEL